MSEVFASITTSVDGAVTGPGGRTEVPRTMPPRTR
jgi:hypothetical protein